MKKFYFFFIEPFKLNGTIAQVFTLITSLLTLFLTSNLEAQEPFVNCIDSLKIIPTVPTTNDSVKVICYSFFGNSSCGLTSSSVNISGTKVVFIGSYWTGNTDEWCHSTDTLTVGKLTAGTYELTYYLMLGDTLDIDTINFTVENTSGFNPKYNLECEIGIYPNPSSTTITISTPTTSNTNTFMTIFSPNGREISSQKIIQPKTVVDIGGLPTGLYFVRVVNDRKVSVGKFVKR